jgi:O-acetyl-ADP-ribose deacetylase (regulator of RNase III)
MAEVGGKAIELVRGDITHELTDAIVNAANSSLLGGGGVDGAIHRAGGPEILDACKRIRVEHGTCPTGRAVLTTAGRLPARFVIHAVGPVWNGGGHGEAELLASCYRAALALADDHRLHSIAFPSISTGAYGYPEAEAAEIALRVVREHLSGVTPLTQVRFVLFADGTLRTYQAALERILGTASSSDQGPG